MKKLLRRIAKTLLVLALVLVVLVVVVLIFLGPIIRTAAEQIGPKVLGVPVKVQSVSVSLFKGRFELRQLRVDNPKGYSSDPLVSLGTLRVVVRPGSLPGKGPIEVREVTILDPKVSYEIVDSVSNVDALLKNLKGDKPAAGEPKATEPRPDTTNAPPARKVIIDHLEFRGGEVSVRMAITAHKAVTMPLPPIVMNDIGKQGGGTSIAQAVTEIWTELSSAVGKAVIGVLNGVSDAAKAGAEAVKDAGKGAVNAIKNLLP